MKSLFVLIVFLALLWLPVIFKIYGWKEGLILTVSLSIASWLIDKYILSRKRRNESE